MPDKTSLQLPEAFEQYRSLIQDTLIPIVKVSTTERKTSLFESKFAGDPYFPASMEYPKNEEGIPLKLLAQINFENVPVHLPHFPHKGILQFYIDGNDDLLGVDFDDGQNQSGFRVIYHEKVIQDESQLIQDFSFVKMPDDELFFPVEQEMGLAFETDLEALTEGDYRSDEMYAAIFDEINHDEKLEEAFFQLFNGTGHKLGGYPFFTQEDPRAYGDYQDADILLLQMDSSGDKIVWGDSGVGNFFISEEDLKNKDFSKVLFNWDCY
ncbi:YwqG family protein [Oceanobacillus oncorhynchi]|uniref:YwqG family protein n=1 Tax=Oceanobacillus oncorhynchi TaxID=545501 RepID=UPI001865B11F|nr:YwqG family protein [Oceanobacillus oncorhynchi]